MRLALAAAAAALLTTVVLAAPGGAGATAAASTGPKLTVPATTLRAALTCHGSLARSTRPPVLFLHGTTSNSKSDWSWNWNRALAQMNWAYCDVDFPDSGNGDIQISAEYVVSAIRYLHAQSHRSIGLVGHSQGGMIGRWALKYWPDTRAMVGDYVGLSSSNNGTEIFNAECALPIGCDAANWQQRQRSNFLTALNKGPNTYANIAYTEIATTDDEIVVPYTSPFLPRAKNVTDVTVQQLCPLETVDHFGMSYDNAAWLIGLDALTHAGPAELSRVSRATCGAPFMPAVDPIAFPGNVAAALAQTVTSVAKAKNLPAEPPLRPYAR